jgi:RNA polymerase sigma factor (TIGR02999 family)
VESELAELVYQELRRLALLFMRRERGNHTLQPSALVNEAWERLAEQPNISWQDRNHFFAVAANCMRNVLVDYARRRRATKRGGDKRQVTLHDHLLAGQERVVDLLALNEALDGLKALDARACQIVEMHFFGGLSFEEIAQVLHISARTVGRDWDMARRWLHNQLAAAE